MAQKVTGNELDAFLGNRSAAAPATPTIPGAPAAPPENAIVQGLAQVNQVASTGNNVLSQIVQITENVAKITDNISQFISPKSMQRKAEANGQEFKYDDYVQQQLAPLPPSPATQNEIIQKPTTPEHTGNNIPVPAQMLDDKANRAHFFVEQTLAEVAKQRPEMTITEILEEWKEGKDPLIQQMQKVMNANAAVQTETTEEQKDLPKL